MRDLVIEASDIKPGDILMYSGLSVAVVYAVRHFRGHVELHLTSGVPVDLYATDRMSVRRYY